jgi:hypothetical protein
VSLKKRKKTAINNRQGKLMNTKFAAAQAQVQIHGQLTEKKERINAGRLTRTTIAGIVALAIYFLAQPVVANPANPVTRPLKIVEGHLTITVYPTGAYEFTDWGWATLIGKYSNSGSAGPGGLDLETGEFVAGSGVVVTANGDTINWIVGIIPNTILDISGTGVFQGVIGGFAVNVLSETVLSSTADTLTLAITYDGSGTLTY